MSLKNSRLSAFCIIIREEDVSTAMSSARRFRVRTETIGSFYENILNDCFELNILTTTFFLNKSKR